VTLTFDLFSSKSNHFIFTPNCTLVVNWVKFAQAVCKILRYCGGGDFHQEMYGVTSRKNCPNGNFQGEIAEGDLQGEMSRVEVPRDMSEVELPGGVRLHGGTSWGECLRGTSREKCRRGNFHGEISEGKLPGEISKGELPGEIYEEGNVRGGLPWRNV